MLTSALSRAYFDFAQYRYGVQVRSTGAEYRCGNLL